MAVIIARLDLEGADEGPGERRFQEDGVESDEAARDIVKNKIGILKKFSS